MRSFSNQLSTYQQQHTNKVNRITHYIGIPAIVIALLILFNWISIDIAARFQISFSWLLLVSVLSYYFLLTIRLALCMMFILIPLTWITTQLAAATPTKITAITFLILFFGGWILQFIGHFFEKQKPAFLISASQLLIGPLFVLIEALQALGIAKYFIRNSGVPAEE